MDVMGLGTYAMDILIRVDALPGADGFCVVKETARMPGGSGANVIVQLARLGADCGYMAQVGDDQVGGEVIGSLKEAGIATDAIRIKKDGSSLYTEIVVDDHGEKFILLNMGDACLGLRPEDVDRKALEKSRVLYTDMVPGAPAAAALRFAREHGIRTAFNMQVGLETMEGLGISRNEILESLRWVDVFAPCRDGLYALAGTTDADTYLPFLRQWFKGVLVVTLGAQGSIAFDENDRLFTAKPCPISPVDTTGAGDSYMGAFIYAYMLQAKPLDEAMSFATRCASYTCCGLGARTSPTLAQINAWEVAQ